MTRRLRWVVLASSTALALLAGPECWTVITEELAAPLAARGERVVVHDERPPAEESEVLAMRPRASEDAAPRPPDQR